MKDLKVTLEGYCHDLGCEAVAVFVNRPERRLAERVAYVGEEPRPTVPFGVTPLGECAAGAAAIHREVKNTKENKYHSYLYLPLIDAEGAWGAMSFAAVRPDFFADPSRVHLAQHCAQCLTRFSLKA